MKKKHIYYIIGAVVIILLLQQADLFITITDASGTFEWKGIIWEYTITSGGINADETPYFPTLDNTTSIIMETNSINKFKESLGRYYNHQGSINLISDINLCDYKKVKLISIASLSISTETDRRPFPASVSITGKSLNFGNTFGLDKSENFYNMIYETEDGDLWINAKGDPVTKSSCPQVLILNVYTGLNSNDNMATSKIILEDIFFDTDGDDVWDRDDFAPNDPNIWEEGQEVEEPTVVYVEAPPTTYYEPTRVSPITATTITTEDEEGLSKNMVALIAAGLGGLYILTSKPKKK